jgi:hypothetical protein
LLVSYLFTSPTSDFFYFPWHFLSVYHHHLIISSFHHLTFLSLHHYLFLSLPYILLSHRHHSTCCHFMFLFHLFTISLPFFSFLPFIAIYSHLSPFLLLLIYCYFTSHLLLSRLPCFRSFLVFFLPFIFFIFSCFLPFACYLFSSIFCLVLVFAKLLLSVVLTHCFSGLRTGEWRVGFQHLRCAVFLSKFAVEEWGFQKSKSSLSLTRGASARLSKGKIVLVVR